MFYSLRKFSSTFCYSKNVSIICFTSFIYFTLHCFVKLHRRIFIASFGFVSVFYKSTLISGFVCSKLIPFDGRSLYFCVCYLFFFWCNKRVFNWSLYGFTAINPLKGLSAYQQYCELKDVCLFFGIFV